MSTTETRPEPIVSVSGLRGIVGESLTPEVAIRYLCAFVAELPAGAIVLARDGRTTGPMLLDILSGTLCALGRDVVRADVAATPTVGVLVRQHHAAGGIQISASHNPPPYNGLKLFGGDGRVISAARGEPVLRRYRNDSWKWAPFDRIGTNIPCNDTTSQHLESVLRIVNVPAIRAQRLRVVLDSNHGAGAVLGARLLDVLGCDTTLLGPEPDGRFAHPPEPIAENVGDIGDMVQNLHADIGFCQDPDADRLALIDERGQFVGEEYTLAVCVQHILSQRSGPIVTNCSTSRMCEDLAREHNVPFYRSKVGEANVADLMLAKEAIFGGEGNGGPIDPRVGYVRDSFVGMALVLDALATRRQTLSQLTAGLPRYAIYKTKIEIDASKIDQALQAVIGSFPDAHLDRLDGVRLDWPGRWLLLRASNTEPIVRIIAEAESTETARAICDQAMQLMQFANRES